MCLANGVPLPLPRDLAADVVAVLVATGRAIPAGEWIPALKQQRRVEREKSLPHNLV